MHGFELISGPAPHAKLVTGSPVLTRCPSPRGRKNLERPCRLRALWIAAGRSGVGLGDVDSAAADAAPGVRRSRTGHAFGAGVSNERRLLHEHVCCRPLPTRHPGQLASSALGRSDLALLAARPPSRDTGYNLSEPRGAPSGSGGCPVDHAHDHAASSLGQRTYRYN